MTTDDPRPAPPEGPALQGLLGYLNFSEGRPDPRSQKQLNDAFASLAGQPDARPWQALPPLLLRELERLRHAGSAAFQDTRQAEAVVRLALEDLLSAYRRH